MSATVIFTILTALVSKLTPWLRSQLSLAMSGAWQLNPLDFICAARVGLCAGAAFAAVSWLDRVIPDGMPTVAAVSISAAACDLVLHRLLKEPVK